MVEIPLYNSRIMKTYIEYLTKFHPHVDVGLILKEANISMHQLEDGGHWFTQQQHDCFHRVMNEHVSNVNIPREAGRYAPFSKASGLVTQYTLGFITPKAAYMVLEKLYPHLSRALILRSNIIASNKIEIEAIPKPGVAESVYQCENRTGTFEAIAKLFTGKFAHIDHPLCMHKGASFCKYVLSWEETSTIRWKRYKQFAVGAGFILGAIALIFHNPSYWDAIIILYLLGVFGIYNHLNHLEKDELVVNIRSKGDSAEHLLNQINQRYNESLLVKEIGQATSMILNIDDLLKFIMESLEKRLDFDRGMIMLVNKEGTRLVYKVGFGYHINGKMDSQPFEFHLDKPESKGVVVETFRKKKPYLVNDITEFEKNFSERSRSVAKQMEVSSFICVPIVFEQEAMGILMVDNIRSKRPLTESDMSLLMGIAPQVAISITNATSFEKIRSSEERFKALSENAPDIIYTVDSLGLLTYVNPAWERVLGHKEEAVLGESLVNFIHKEDAGLFVDNFDKIRKKRQNTINLFGRLNHKNGEERLFSMSGAPNLDALGQVIGVVGTFKDITDLKRSEAELQISFNKLKSAMNNRRHFPHC